MSLYNALFGMNQMSDVLLAALGLTRADVGRFRDCYIQNDRIAVYTRNGGGNRDCWHRDHDWYASKGCKHESRVEAVPETVTLTDEEAKQHPEFTPLNVWIGSKRMYGTGRMVEETQYRCVAPDSEECSCPGCIISYRLRKHPLYLTDRDDDFDTTYATIWFRFPEEVADDLKAFGAGDVVIPSEKWDALFAALEQKR